MYVILFLSAIISFVYGDRDDREITQNCFSEIGISPEFYRSAMESDIKVVGEKIKCVDVCLLKAYKVMNKDGFIDFDEIIKIMPDSLIADPEAVKTVIKTCNQMRGDDDCVTAHLLMTCMHNEMSKFFGK